MKECKIHYLKLSYQYFDAVQRREKNFEIRYNDRNYCEGDWLVLREWDGDWYTGYEIARRIVHVYKLDDIGLENWVAMSIE